MIFPSKKYCENGKITSFNYQLDVICYHKMDNDWNALNSFWVHCKINTFLTLHRKLQKLPILNIVNIIYLKKINIIIFSFYLNLLHQGRNAYFGIYIFKAVYTINNAINYFRSQSFHFTEIMFTETGPNRT